MTAPARPFGTSEVGRLMAELDWESTPLGTPGGWPDVLRRTVRMMLASKQQMALFWGPQYALLYNDAYLPVIGGTLPGKLGRPVREVWGGELQQVLLPLLAQVVNSGEAFWAHDHPFPLNRQGFVEETYFDISYDPVPLQDGRIGGVLCLVTETTDRVLSRRRIRTLSELGAATVGAQQTDEVAHEVVGVLLGNPDDVPFAQVYLRDADTLRRVASTLGEHESGPLVIRPGDGTPAGKVTAEVLGTGKPVPVPAAAFIESAFIESGPLPDIEVALALPITIGGGVHGVLVAAVNPRYPLPGAYRDFYDVLSTSVSASVANAQAHQRERRQVAALAELDRAKTEFFSNVSHEFRTPLMLISSPAEDALADLVEPLPAGQRNRLEIVRRNAGRLRRLVDDMLDFARIEAGRLLADTVALDLAELTRGIVDSFAPAIERAGLRLQIDCPPLTRTAFVDPDMWEKIVLSLLSNALKYTHKGQITVALRPQGDRAQDNQAPGNQAQVELTVTDTGVGIPAEQLPLLFQRFHRVRSSVGRSHEGAGLGLALVHELVRLHGGEVTADSCEGQGSTFTVRLPFGRAATVLGAPKRTSMVGLYLDEALQWTTQPTVAVASVEEAARAAVRVSSRAPTETCVLVAEDNADMRAYLTALLEPHYTVISTADGQAALQAVQRIRPDVVLADVMMPVLDGFELLAQLRGDPRTAAIPVILLSARSGEEAAIEGLAAGANDYLVKPFSAPELLARVRSSLELGRLRSHESAWRVALLNALQDGFVVATADGTIIEMNEAFATLFGYGPEGLPYRVPYPWWPDPTQDPDGFQQINTVFAAAQVHGGGRFVLRLRHRTGHPVWAAVAVSSVLDQDGQQQLIVCTSRDVTTEHLAAQRQATLARFTERLIEARGVRDVLDVGVAEFRDQWKSQQAFAVSWSRSGQIDLITGDTSWATMDSSIREAITAAHHSGELHMSTDGAGTAIPVQTGVRVAVLWLDIELSSLRGEDRLLLTGLCEQLTHALAQANAFDEHRAVAITLQRAILGPTDLPAGFAVRYQPAVGQLEVGGDWYDVVRLDEDRVGVVVGDCVGRGLGAAAVMGQLRSACRALLLQSLNAPRQVLAALDDFAALIPDARCTTLCCAIIDLTTAQIRYSSAGHPPGLLVHLDGSSETLDAANSVPLATMPSLRERPEATTTLRPGSTLLLYTDGLIEHRRESLADGMRRARATLLDLRTVAPEPLATQLAERLLGRGHDDDVAYLIYRQPHPVLEPFSADLPADPHYLRPLRQSLRAWLATAVVAPCLADRIVLAVHEACTNAIEHAHRFDPDLNATITATATLDAVEVIVSDHGHWKPPSTGPSNRGRGLPLMDLLMDDVSVTAGEAGTIIRLRKGLR
ncbi:MAG TPA: SpoIIE family protein phosphatase [Pseudonocardiaceae bacterium]|nr:SpoIIE family protein phosphatase [Pseudonocardiaceae bacterium]